MAEMYGKRLLCNVLREEVACNPNRLFAIIYKSNDVVDGFHRVTFRQVADAANYLSIRLQKLFDGGKKPTGHPTIAYCGIPDIRYTIFFFAAVQCGYQVFFPSTKNTNNVNVALLEKTACTRMVYSSEVAPLVASLQKSLPDIHCEQVDPVHNLLAVPSTNYPYSAQYDDVVDHPIVIVHSSGSTGVPKIVRYTHGTICTLDVRDYGFIEGRLNHDAVTTLRFSDHESCAYDLFPPSHLAGLNMKIFVPTYNLTAAIFGPPTRPPTGALAAQIMKIHRPTGACLPPSIIEQLFHEPGSDEIFKALKILVFTGGPLPKAIGDHICKFTRVAQQYGSSEMGSVRQLLPDMKDWQWIEFHPTESLELQPYEDGLYELVLFTNQEQRGSSWLYHTFPDVTEWRSRDLFERHPENPILWRFFGRVDDVLVFSSGEKVFPVPMESALTALSEIKGALVVGSGFSQSALLVELADNVPPSIVTSNKFWKEVETANSLLPAYGRVSRSMLIIASPDRPFARAGKGTVIRRQTESSYSYEIQRTLSRNQTEAEAPIVFRPSVFQLRDVRSLVRAILSRVSVAVDVDDATNLYDLGLDSVKTAEAIGHLKKSLLPYKSTTELNQLTLEFMYLNPTITQLSSALLAFINEGRLSMPDRIGAIRTMIEQYTWNIPQSQMSRANGATTNSTINRPFCVAVTGTTGFFGAYILRDLARNSDISHVYCLDRSADAHNKAKSHQATDSKLRSMQIDFTADRLGLTETQHDQLIEECDLLIHNAWQVDFNRPLSHFDPSLNSVRQLVNMSAKSPLRPRVLFISSISATGDFAEPGSAPETIAEEISEDLSKSMKLGYGESKLVAENVLKAAARAGIPVTVLRLGLLVPKAGDPWPDAYGLSAFLRTCKASGLIATDLSDLVDWLPVDDAASVVDDLVRHELGNRVDSSPRVLNLVHPHPVSWAALNSALQSWCGKDAKLVTTKEWVRLLGEQDFSSSDVLDRFPALRMWDLFRLLAGRGPTRRYATDKIKSISDTMKTFTPINELTISSWLQQL